MLGRGIITKDLSILEDIGIISQIRGRDGAGIYRVNTSSRTWTNELLHKSGSDFCNLLYDIETTKVSSPISSIFTSCMPNLFIGHVRAKTKGDVSNENAHPFEFPNLVGAHNGTLKDKKYEHYTKTDSELMFIDMSERGMMPVLQELEDDSAFALVMYNKEDKQVYFARNEYRTLYFAKLTDRNVLYWASEKAILELALNRKREKYTIFWAKDNHLYSIDPAEFDSKEDKFLTHHGVISQKKEEEKKRLEAQWKAKMAEDKRLAELTNNQEVKTNDVPFDVSSIKTETKVVIQQGGEPSKVLQFPIENSRNRKDNYTSDNLVNGIQPISPKQRSSYGNFTFRTHCVICTCGQKMLNVHDSYLVRKGLKVFPNYDSNTDTFSCESCVETKQQVH